MEVIYRVNGKEFNTQEQAKDYELELERKEQERIEKAREKNKQFKELCDAANKYMELYEAYEKEYGKENRRVGDTDSCSSYSRSEEDKRYGNLSDLIQDILELF